jgi:pectin methylesterase-like acyl-CoA thioesterase
MRLKILICAMWLSGYSITASGAATTEPIDADLTAAMSPAPAATNVCPDTPLRLTFTATPTLGAGGKIQVFDSSNDTIVETTDVSSRTSTQAIGGLPNFKYYPVIVAGNQACIYLHNHALSYNKTYYVTIDPGVFKDSQGIYRGISNGSDWRFTTKAAAPAAGAARLTIAADGDGDFRTVQGAVDFVPDGNTTPTTLFIRKGTYTELVYFANKHALTFQGEDRKQTVIEYANNAKFNSASDQRTYHRGVFLANRANDLVIENLTIRNTTPRGGSQAEAIILKGATDSRAIVSDVDLYSFQDTLQINGQAYINNCYIEGDVDFMWGTGPCFFENCLCTGTRSNAYYTQIRNTAKNHGYVFHHCTFDGPPGVTGMYLSRIAPKVYPNSEVVLMDCVLGKSVGDVAWLLNGGNEAPNLHFWEFNSHDPDGNPVDVTGRLAVSRQLKQPDDAATIADYSSPTYVLGNNWVPQPPTIPATQPGK